MNSIFYSPKNAAVGDVIPCFMNGEFKVFYLQLSRAKNQPDLGPVWHLIETTDLLYYRERGSCGIHGGTGAVLCADGLYHMFYCVFPEGRQVVAHATSTDLVHWQPCPEDDLEADSEFYVTGDWRDPHVLWNEEEGLYWMLIAARAVNDYNRNGCVGLCVSNDLKTWQARPPLYAPNQHTSALECADLFRIGDWWYLVYSTYTDRFVTHYRMSRSSCGPWLTPPEDTFDGRAFYAAKTATDGQKRYAFGWNPTRTENIFNWNPPGYAGRDFNTWDWGGSLVVHEIVQNLDGTLAVRLPDSIVVAFRREQPTTLQPLLGDWEQTGQSHTVSTPQGFACATAGLLPGCCLVTAQFRFALNTRRLGLILRASDKLDQGYTLQIEPDRQRVVFKSYPFTNEHGGKILSHEVELERPLPLSPDRQHAFKLVIENSVCELYLDNQVAMSARMYDLQDGQLLFFAVDGEATFENIRVKTA